TEGSRFKKLLDLYDALPKEFFYDWDFENETLNPPIPIAHDSQHFFATSPNGVNSPTEAAVFDQMSDFLHRAAAVGVNAILRPAKTNDLYFEAMDASNMDYRGMLINPDQFDQAGEIMRAMTPEGKLIEESSSAI